MQSTAEHLENFVRKRGRLHSDYKKAKPAAFKWKKVGLAAFKMLQGESMAALKEQKGGVSRMQEFKTR